MHADDDNDNPQFKVLDIKDLETGTLFISSVLLALILYSCSCYILFNSTLRYGCKRAHSLLRKCSIKSNDVKCAWYMLIWEILGQSVFMSFLLGPGRAMSTLASGAMVKISKRQGKTFEIIQSPI